MASVSERVTSVGRRKTANARVILTPGQGNITVNKRDFEDYFVWDTTRGYIKQPLSISGVSDQYDIQAKVQGGGLSGQAGALRHAIARALVKTDDELKSVLKESGMLTRDARMKERKKYGQPGSRKKPQFSKR